MMFSLFTASFDLMGSFVFALSGALVGVRRKMDIFGVLVLAIVTAFGGGSLRSILMGDLPIPFLKDIRYIIACIIATVIVFVFREQFKKLKKPIAFFDALGLGFFLSLGMTISLQHGFSWWASVILGTITASFGGVIRDIFSAQIPLIFQKEAYASICIMGGLFYLLLQSLSISGELVNIATMLFVFVLRVAAIKYHWSLPK